MRCWAVAVAALILRPELCCDCALGCCELCCTCGCCCGSWFCCGACCIDWGGAPLCCGGPAPLVLERAFAASRASARAVFGFGRRLFEVRWKKVWILLAMFRYLLLQDVV